MPVWMTKNWFACRFAVKRIGLDERCLHDKLVWILSILVCHWFAKSNGEPIMKVWTVLVIQIMIVRNVPVHDSRK